jgi:uncharacterized OB-fold protein
MNLIEYLKEENDLRGVIHVDCGKCGADAHIVGANRFKESHDNAQYCPYCGAEGDNETVRLIDEHEQAVKYDPDYN